MLQVKTGTAWAETYARCRAVAPEAFAEDHLQNLVAGRVGRLRGGPPAPLSAGRFEAGGSVADVRDRGRARGRRLGA